MAHRHFQLEGSVVWGYVTDAESLSGEEIFVGTADEESARAHVDAASWRRLAKRMVGPVEIVEG